MAKSSPAAKPKPSKPAASKLSRQRPPENVSVEEWQRRLRQQFGREQTFLLENLGEDPVFSEFAGTNPQSGGRYRVAIRGAGLGENFCSCPDFATNDLGTCKHIEFTLGKIEARKDGKAMLAQGFNPVYSEIYLHYGQCSQRAVSRRSFLPADTAHPGQASVRQQSRLDATARALCRPGRVSGGGATGRT